jgi:DNA-binding transcriptional ArsR family regulator
MILNVNQKLGIDIQQLDPQTQVFKVLTHPTRIAILYILRDGEHCVCHMEAHMGLRQSYISQQLAVLREAGLIQDRRDGWNIYYRVVNPDIYKVLDAAQNLTGQTNLNHNKSIVECTCPHCNKKTD